MTLQLLHYRQNYSVGIFQTINFIFGAYCPSLKPLVFFLLPMDFLKDQQLPTRFFQRPVSIYKFISKILTDNILKLILSGYSIDITLKCGSI